MTVIIVTGPAKRSSLPSKVRCSREHRDKAIKLSLEARDKRRSLVEISFDWVVTQEYNNIQEVSNYLRGVFDVADVRINGMGRYHSPRLLLAIRDYKPTPLPKGMNVVHVRAMKPGEALW